MTCPDNSKPWRRNTPGSPCCDDCPCTIVKHTFSAGPLSDCWTLKTGSWNDAALVDGYASATGAVEAWHVTPHPDDPYPSDVRMRVRGATGAVLRIILSASGNVASGDALIVELTPGEHCGTLKLYQRLDGVEDLLATQNVYGAVVDEWHDLRACYDPETTVLTGSILPRGETSWRQTSVEVEAHTDGASAGFASGTDDQSDFDTFVFRKLWYDRIITPLCPQMTVETTQTAQVEVEGVQPEWGCLLSDWGEGAWFNIQGPHAGATAFLYGDYPDRVNLAAALSAFMATQGVECESSGTYLVFTGSGAGGYALGQYDVQILSYGGGCVAVIDYYTAGTVPVAPQNEQQTITLVQDGDEGCRVFSLSWGGQTTDPISTSADAATVQAALETLCGAGNVSVTGPAGAWVVEFVGELAETDVAMLAADTTVCGNCLDYSYYYEPETERVTCSTCDPPQCAWATGHFADADSICEWQTVEGEAWTIVPETWYGYTYGFGAHQAYYHTLQTTESSSVLLHWGMRFANIGDVHKVYAEFYTTGTLSFLLVVTASDASNFLGVVFTPRTGTNGKCGDVSVIQRAGGVDAVVDGPWRVAYADHLNDGDSEEGDGRAERLLCLFAEYNDGELLIQLANSGDGIRHNEQSADRGNCLAPVDNVQHLWARNWIVNEVSYKGRFAGVGTAGGTGKLYVVGFDAGCLNPALSCCHESDTFDWPDEDDWYVDPWKVVSGTAPTRVGDWPVTPSGKLEFSAFGMLIHRNPLSAMFTNAHKVTAGFTITRSNAAYVDSFGVVFGANADGTDYWYAEYTGDANTATAKLWHVVDGEPSALADSESGSPTSVVGITACVSEAAVTANVAGATLRSIAPNQSSGVRWGVKVTPQNAVALTGITASKTGYLSLSGPDGTVEQSCSGCSIACARCIDGLMPETVLADVVGLESVVCNCAGINLAYELLPVVGQCAWVHVGNDLLCNGAATQLQINTTFVIGSGLSGAGYYPAVPVTGLSIDPGKWYLVAKLSYSVFGSTGHNPYIYYFAKEIAIDENFEIDCMNFDHERLAYIGADFPYYDDALPACGYKGADRGDGYVLMTDAYIEITSL